MKKYAQAISEYVVLFAVVAAALTLMQLYFRRSIQSVIKIAADEVGTQKEGASAQDYDFAWVERQNTATNTTFSSTTTEERLMQAAAIRRINENTRQEGGITFGVRMEKE